MDVSASLSSAAASAARGIDGTASAGNIKANVQINALKKALQAQQDAAAELLRQTEGKGQILDIRA